MKTKINYKKKFRAKQQGNMNKLAHLEQADYAYYITSAMLLELASRSYEIFIGSEPEDKREIIGLTLQNLFLNEGKLDCIFETTDNLRWGPKWETIRTLEYIVNLVITCKKIYPQIILE